MITKATFIKTEINGKVPPIVFEYLQKCPKMTSCLSDPGKLDFQLEMIATQAFVFFESFQVINNERTEKSTAIPILEGVRSLWTQ